MNALEWIIFILGVVVLVTSVLIALIDRRFGR